uniref:Uncharacterized protein n=1 Tax=Amphimedon queenslandica TaxID=400682 RepID=A0A1X7TY03_AMPQE
MHDVLEGVTQYEVKELLKHLIGEKVITVDTLNGTIETFPYCYSDVQDKPTLISQTTLNSSDHSEKQKAAQMWNLVRFLPIMIGHKISRRTGSGKINTMWTKYVVNINLLSYCNGITHEVSVEGVAYYSNLVELQNANTVTE